MSQAIERDSPVPYYEQLFHILKKQIVDGDIAEEARLPSELEFCREYGLSRATVRQTFSKLESEGFARRVPRRGVFAAKPEEPSGWTVQEGFLESQLRHGRTGIETRVVSAGEVTSPRHVAEALGLAFDAPVYALERVRSLDGRVAMFSTNWLPSEIGAVVAASADVLDGSGSLNNALREGGHVAASAQRMIRATGAPASVAARLGIGEGSPILQVRSLSIDGDGKPFDYYETWVLTDVIPLEVNVSAA